jgi:hypothetical protein
MLERLHLALAPHGALQARAQRPEASHLEHFNRFRNRDAPRDLSVK